MLTKLPRKKEGWDVLGEYKRRRTAVREGSKKGSRLLGRWGNGAYTDLTRIRRKKKFWGLQTGKKQTKEPGQRCTLTWRALKNLRCI